MNIQTRELPVLPPDTTQDQNALDYFVRAHQTGEVVRVFGEREQYYLGNPEHIREVLVTRQESFEKGYGLKVLKVLIGDGILTSEGETHQRQRQMMQPFYNMRHVGLYADQMVKYAQEQMNRWQNGEVRDVTEDMMELTLDIITDTMFGTSVKEDLDAVREAVNVLMHKFIEKVQPRTEPESPEQAAERDQQIGLAAQTLFGIISKIVEERRSHPQAERSDLLSNLLHVGMSEQELRDQVITIFLAGHETTSNTLAWTWYLLAQNPEAEQKLWAELDDVLGGRLPTAEDYAKLTYTHQILNESMRLYPAAWTISRMAKEDIEIGGYEFKAGAEVVMSQWAVHRDARWFEQPEAFVPERWTPEFLKQLPPYAFFPFGGGPRICIGNNFAMLEAVLALATIGQRYRFELVEGIECYPEPLITLRAANLQMKVIDKQA